MSLELVNNFKWYIFLLKNHFGVEKSGLIKTYQRQIRLALFFSFFIDGYLELTTEGERLFLSKCSNYMSLEITATVIIDNVVSL